MRRRRLSRVFALAVAFTATAAGAADVNVRLKNAPAAGSLVFQVYDAADAFGDLRDPAREFTYAAGDGNDFLLSGVPDGKVAVVVYHDENGNGLIDKNFIGIPREPLAISNNYQPKGPPSFSRASIDVAPASTLDIDMQMYRVLGERGRFGFGAGVIGRGSPYVDSTQAVTRGIPAITYVGERLQWFGPTLRYGLTGSGRLRLAAAVDYRLAAYEESDSTVLDGLGDREDLLLAGLGLQYEISNGFELELAYQHDILDRVGGGVANARLSRGFPLGIATFVPQVAFNWRDGKISDHEFGVPASAATPTRPAYQLGSTTSLEAGLGVFVELSEDWRIIVNVAAERLDDDVVASPIVADDVVVNGVAIVTYVF